MGLSASGFGGVFPSVEAGFAHRCSLGFLDFSVKVVRHRGRRRVVENYGTEESSETSQEKRGHPGAGLDFRRRDPSTAVLPRKAGAKSSLRMTSVRGRIARMKTIG